jgi:hypothetical protein
MAARSRSVALRLGYHTARTRAGAGRVPAPAHTWSGSLAYGSGALAVRKAKRSIDTVVAPVVLS